MDKEDNIITFKPKTGSGNPTKSSPKVPDNQTNPIYKTLFKFIHINIKDDKNNNLSKYKPEDIL